MKIDFKKLRLARNKTKQKDPSRYPKVSDVYEQQSKRDFMKSIDLELKQIIKEVENIVNSE